MDYLDFAKDIDPKAEYEIYFYRNKLAYELYGPMVVGKIVLPNLTEASPELDSNYILIRIDAQKSDHVNDRLNNDQLHRLKTHGIMWSNIDPVLTLGVY